jgi:hypothetical protein
MTERAWWHLAQRADVAVNVLRSLPVTIRYLGPERAVAVTTERLKLNLLNHPPPAVEIPPPIKREMCRRLTAAVEMIGDIPMLSRGAGTHVVDLAVNRVWRGEHGPDLEPLATLPEPIRPVPTPPSPVPRVGPISAEDRRARDRHYRNTRRHDLHREPSPTVSVNSNLNRILRGVGFEPVERNALVVTYARGDDRVEAMAFARWRYGDHEGKGFKTIAPLIGAEAAAAAMARQTEIERNG